MSLYITDESGKLHKIAGAGGGSGVVDDALNPDSENPVQNKVITNKINSIVGESKNLFDVNTIVKGGELSGSTGEIVFGNSTKYVSDYIYIKGIANLYLSGNRTYGKGIAYYTDNKTFISTEILSGFTGVLTPPSNASYLRINGNLTDTNVQIEVGTEATEYEPYRSKLVYADDIADVEHIEVLYDMNDTAKQTIGGDMFTSGIPSGETISSDFSKYKRLICECNLRFFNAPITIDLEHPTNNTSNVGYAGAIQGVERNSDASTTYRVAYLKVVPDKTTLEVLFRWFINNYDTTNDLMYITQIRGVLA